MLLLLLLLLLRWWMLLLWLLLLRLLWLLLWLLLRLRRQIGHRLLTSHLPWLPNIIVGVAPRQCLLAPLSRFCYRLSFCLLPCFVDVVTVVAVGIGQGRN